MPLNQGTAKAGIFVAAAWAMAVINPAPFIIPAKTPAAHIMVITITTFPAWAANCSCCALAVRRLIGRAITKAVMNKSGAGILGRGTHWA